MSKIKSVAVQPNTQGEQLYKVGKETYYKSGLIITDIQFTVDEGVSELVIFANNEMYADFVNVPCVLYFQ
jgi:hypothetical protein